MARESTPAEAPAAAPALRQAGAREALVRLLAEINDADLLCWYLIPLVEALVEWRFCGGALGAVIGAARYSLDSVWSVAHDHMPHSECDEASEPESETESDA
jgi:hypothetical protein